MKKMKKLGVALGSGGVRGLALVGVLKVLEENNIKIDYLSGCSIGAFFAAYYAYKQDAKDLEAKAFSYRKEIFLSFIQPSLRGGLSSGKKLHQLVHKLFGRVRFEDLSIPTRVVATDLISGQEVDYSKGPVAPAVLASMAMPFFYQPVHYQGKTLVDGVLVNPVPDNLVKKMGADVVIAVNLHNYRLSPKFQATSLYSTSLRSMQIAFENLSRYSLLKESILVEPAIKTSGLGSWKDFFLAKRNAEIIRAGETAMKKALPKILKRLK